MTMMRTDSGPEAAFQVALRRWDSDNSPQNIAALLSSDRRRLQPSMPTDVHGILEFCGNDTKKIHAYLESLDCCGIDVAVMSFDMMGNNRNSQQDWIYWYESFVAKSKSGDPSRFARRVYDFATWHSFEFENAKSRDKWFLSVLKADRIGTPAESAVSYFKKYYYHSSPTGILKTLYQIIENARTGNPAAAALELYGHYASYSNMIPLDWVKKVVETTKAGDPAGVAADIGSSFPVQREWALTFIGRCQIGNPAEAAVTLCEATMRRPPEKERHPHKKWVGSNEKPEDLAPYKGWARGVVKAARVGNVATAAYAMFKLGVADLKWTKKIIEKCKTKDRNIVIDEMIEDRIVPASWRKS